MVWRNLLNLLQLMRVELVLAAISNSWLVIFLSRGPEVELHRPSEFTDLFQVWQALPLVAIISAGLSAYGTAYNDALDARHDRTFSPDRPIPAGGINPDMAIRVALLSLLVAILGAIFLPKLSMLLCLVTAAAVLFFNMTGKFLPPVGIILFGLIWAGNMVIPNPTLGYAWPVFLTITHVIACSAVAYILEAKRPLILGPDWWGLILGWVFWALIIVGWMFWQNTLALPQHPLIWVGPAAMVGLFLLVSWLLLRRHMNSPARRRRAGARFSQVSVAWLILYNAGWLFGAGMNGPALLMIGVFIAAMLGVWALGLLSRLSGPDPTFQFRSEG
jgi:4-hydroxybenzoate polyprenyltransferase